MSAAGITSITYLPDFGDNISPARVNRKTGEMYINLSRWRHIPAPHRVFILLHEFSHVLLNTSDELAVDQLAFAMYAKLGYSLKEGVRALTTVLSGRKPDHIERAARQLERAKLFDYTVYGNKDVYSAESEKLLNEKIMCGQNTNCGCSGNIPVIMADMYDSYTGCQPGEKPRHCRKRIRVESRAAARENRSEGTRLKGQARAALADQGISEKNIQRGTIMSAIKGTGKAVGDILGKGGGGEDSGGSDDTPKKSNKGLIIGGAIGGGLLLLAIVFMAFKNRK